MRLWQQLSWLPILWLATIGLTTTAFAEPWLASRFAQNCAGCHAPGRLNRAPADRRCSLSCQGCHQNPNGGGLRHAYGKWNSQRWLRSARSLILGHKAAPAPYEKQGYHPENQRGSAKNSKTAQLNTTDTTHPATAAYGREHTPEEKTAPSLSAFLDHVPAEDPYYQRRQNPVTGGLDVRLQWLRQQEPTTESGRLFAMAGDFGLAIRPWVHNVHLVYESRFLGHPAGPPLDEQISSAQTRSLYVLVDDLPFNSYAMGGYYTPLLGNDGPDHTRLSRRMVATALTGNPRVTYNLLYKTFSVGTAPNVPYVNLHRIEKRIQPGSSPTSEEGYALNTGLRFVTLGASVNYSTWRLQNRSTPLRDTRILLQSLYLSSTLWRDRWYLGWEGILTEVERSRDFYRATVQTLESRLRLYREWYATVEIAQANSDETLQPGQALQQKYGVRTFLWPGVDWSAHYVIDRYETDGQSRKPRHYLASQLHLFY
jgi:hypothetical protein